MMKILSALAALSLLALTGCLPAIAAGGTGGVRELTDKSVIYQGDKKAAENAVRKAFDDLGVTVKETVREEEKSGEITFRGKTYDETPLTVDLEPSTPSTTRIEVRVGRIGSKDRAREVHAAIQKHLKPVKGADD
jgi:hypothetical protein